MMESKRCKGAAKASVPRERATRVAECAKAILRKKCGGPTPAECSNVSL